MPPPSSTAAPGFEPAIPILRILERRSARDFYQGFLGFSLDWKHRFAPHLPLYMQVSRGALILHLSEHLGDGTPGTVLYLRMEGIETFHEELAARTHAFARPGIESAPWGARIMEIADPFGNRLRFAEHQPAR